MSVTQNEQNRIVTQNIDDDVIDLLPFLLKLKAKWKLCILGLIIGAVIAAAYATFLVKPQYQATSMVYLRNSGTTVSLQDLQIGSQLTNDYEIIFKSRPIMEKTIKELDLDMTSNQLANTISIDNPDDTRILQITATAETPELARDIANSVTEGGMAAVLEIESQNPYVIEEAVINPIKVGMSRTKMTLIGGFAGLFGVIGILFAMYVISDKVKSADDVERILGLPVLSIIPEDKSLDYNKQMKRRGK